MYKKLFIGLSLLTAMKLQAQDMHFSQFVLAPVFLNPANSGAENKIRAILNYREQWKSVASPYKTVGLSYDMRIHESNSGFFAGGITFYSDKAGDAKMGIAQANLNLAYHLRLQEGMHLGLGIMGGYAQRSVTLDGLQWGNQYDGMDYNSALATGEPTGSNFSNSFGDVGAGVTWSYVKGEKYMTGNDQLAIVAGFSVLHPHQPNYSFYSDPNEILYRRYVAHGHAVFTVSKKSRLAIAPAFLFQMQGGAKELLFGSNFKFRLQESSKYTGFVSESSFSLGCFYRNKDAVILTSMFTYANYSVGFSYDINVSDLKPTSNGKGGFELSLRFIAPASNNKGSNSKFL
jgi:type IX secretion system PorP/SprF family membrane protein